jgi:N utilization substance protein B
MSARHKARKRALDFLFQADLRKADPLALYEEQLAKDPAPVNERLAQEEYVRALIVGVQEYSSQINTLLLVHVKDWDLDRMPAIDRNLARLAIYEMRFGGQDVALVISEAIAIAKELSTENSPTFLNGLLGQIGAA